MFFFLNMKVFVKITIGTPYTSIPYVSELLSTSSLPHLVSNWIWLLQDVPIFLFRPLCWPSLFTLQNLNAMSEVILSRVPSRFPYVLWCGQQHKVFWGILQTRIEHFISKMTRTLLYITFLNVDKKKTWDKPNDCRNSKLRTSTVSQSNMGADAKKRFSFH